MTGVKKSEDRVIAASQSLQEREYWINQFSGELTESTFPYDFEKPLPGDNNGKSATGSQIVSFQLESDSFSRIMTLSNGSDPRVHMILIAAAAALLHRYTGSTDIIMGMPVDKQDIEGEFINTVLTLRLSIYPHMTFKELLLMIKDTVCQAAENQNYPIEALLYDLNLNFSETEFPLFDVAVILENIQDRDYLRHISVNVIFSFLRTPGGITGSVEYNPLLFFESTIIKISKHFQELLAQVLLDVNVMMKDIDFLLPEEREALLIDFNNTAQEYPPVKSPGQLFVEQAEATPDHIAVINRKPEVAPVMLTYKKLNQKAGQLASLLNGKGIGPGAIVGIMMENPIELVIGLLGILKAGGVYLPFSSRYPQERIVYMLKHSQAGILLTDNSENRVGIDIPGVETFEIDSLSGDYPSDLSIAREIGPHDAAYIIYTSGTTGKPKGVVVEHGSVVNTLLCRKDMYCLDTGVRVLQLFSPAFDGFVTSFFTPVIAGASVVMLGEEDVMDITRVKAAIIDNCVTHFISIPTLYRAIIEELTPAEAVSLKVVTLAGDQVTTGLVEFTREKNPALEIAQEYGVTEAAVMSTLYRHQERDTRLKIGRPIWNTIIYIIDNYLRLLPIGVPGELCIAGTGVARGYLNRPELTLERFVNYKIQNHKSQNNKKFLRGSRGQFFQKEPPGRRRQRIYKTGDLARWFSDGSIEFLGRLDFQVKIMGFRIEPAEIENQILTHQQVKETVVMVRETARGSKYLCAYIVPYSADQMPTESQLREFLTRVLPDYMVPAYFLFLERIPLNTNGKIDRQQLPAPTEFINVHYKAPRNELEEILVEIWKSQLSLDRVGINDNYFNIGGDSIQSVKLISIINKRLNKNLKIADLYANNTVAKLANLINESEESAAVDAGEYEKAMEKIAAIKNKYFQGVQRHDR